jgi:hypothetical protein
LDQVEAVYKYATSGEPLAMTYLFKRLEKPFLAEAETTKSFFFEEPEIETEWVIFIKEF